MYGKAHTYTQEQRLKRLNRSLTNHTPTPEQVNRIELLRDVAQAFGVAVIENTPESREQSLAITNLEESLMWAIKAIVLEGDD